MQVGESPEGQLHWMHGGEQESCSTPKGSRGGVCRIFCKYSNLVECRVIRTSVGLPCC